MNEADFPDEEIISCILEIVRKEHIYIEIGIILHIRI